MSNQIKLEAMKQTREINIQSITNSIDDDSRVVEIAFMSEQPVEREINGQIYNEILVTTPDSVDLTRLNTGAPLLYNHNMDWLIGVVENARIDSDRVGRASVRFSATEFADQKYQQVKEGVLTKVSFGYNIRDYYFEGNNLMVTKIEPYELSMVSCPADNKVGVGRSINKDSEQLKEIVMDEENKVEREEVEAVETEEKAVEVEETEVREIESESKEDEEEKLPEERDLEEAKRSLEKARRKMEVEKELNNINAELKAIEDDKAEELNQSRIREIESIAKVFNIDSTEAINNNVSVEDFKREIETQKHNKLNIKEDKMTQQVRTIEALAKAIKGDKSALENLEQGQRGFTLQAGELAQARANTTTVTAAGAIQTNYADDFIQPLLPDSILGRMGVKVYSGMNNREFTIPRLTGIASKASFKFYEEGQAIEESVASFDQIVMRPKLFAGSIPLTRSLILSSPNIERYITDVLLENVAVSLEKAVVDVVEAQATKVETAASGVIADSDIEAAFAKLLTANVKSRDCIAIVSPVTYAKLRQTPFLSNTSRNCTS
ncbi:HK97 family phage prohead protease [Escherichia coli]|uniref:HK97 family phage prohead protease n=1 Tax=Escherichia coli TaxID=562 RepID=UPI000AEFC4FB|nr:HK97 family phage prohead protease [Escherichia coli]